MAYFLNVPGVLGTSSDPFHFGWIELESFSFGRVFGGIGRQSPGDSSEIHCTKKIDRSSHALVQMAANGTHKDQMVLAVAEAEVGALRRGEKRRLLDKSRFVLSDVVISSFQLAGTKFEGVESFTLNAGKIEAKF